jgi:hypothetical protein
MALQSKRARILAALMKQLETISTTNGYATNVAKVTTNVHNWYETPEAETPVLYVVDESMNYQYFPSRLSEREWVVAVYGVMKNRSQFEMEELIADVETCLTKNQTLSFDGERGLVNHHRIQNIVTDNQLFSEIEGSQLFKVSVQILYTVCLDDVR